MRTLCLAMLFAIVGVGTAHAKGAVTPAVQKRWGSFFDKSAGQMDIPKSMNISARQLPGSAKSTFFALQKQSGVIMGAYHDAKTKTFAVAQYTDGEGDARFKFFDAKGKKLRSLDQADDGTLDWR